MINNDDDDDDDDGDDDDNLHVHINLEEGGLAFPHLPYKTLYRLLTSET